LPSVPCDVRMHAMEQDWLDGIQEWLDAITELIARRKPNPVGTDCEGEPVYGKIESSPDPDPRPLAALLRSDKPIPPEIRDTFAELLDPRTPEYLGCRLVLIDTELTEIIGGAVKPRQVSERQGYRRKAVLKALLEGLTGRLPFGGGD